jgi:hypothetical protein
MYITCLSHDTCPAIALRDTLRDCIEPSRRAHMRADVEYVRIIPTPETMTRMFSAPASGALGIRRFAVMPYVVAITCPLGTVLAHHLLWMAFQFNSELDEHCAACLPFRHLASIQPLTLLGGFGSRP